jgi:ABC-2 type transport system ATP-binding protein
MSDRQTAISVHNITKSFKLPHERHSSIKSAFIDVFRGKTTYEKQQVLNDISFEIKKGEFFGIVGRNGSGKSTLLKLLAGIYSPDRGGININGKLTPFIELGVGFNPELTGRENVFLNGALLGFDRKQINDMYDEIVAFAELEKFMDQKLKNYSSGMQVRLAFSIAIRADTEILILDEVLAVGDTNFQKKCYDYFGRIKNTDKTVVLVTHDMSAVERFCDRAIIINEGSILTEGDPSTVTKTYSDVNFAAQESRLEKKTALKKSSQDVDLKAYVTSGGKTNNVVRSSDKEVLIVYTFTSKVDIPEAVFGAIVSDGSGTPIFATNTKVDKQKLSLKAGQEVSLEITVDNIFSNGEYAVSAGIKDYEGTEIFYTDHEAAKFIVGGREHDFAVTSPDYKIKIK